MWDLEFEPKFLRQVRRRRRHHDMSNVARGTLELLSDPYPNGHDQKKVDTQPGLFRKRINLGQIPFRKFYAIKEASRVVQLVALVKRDESTFRNTPRPSSESIPIEFDEFSRQVTGESPMTEEDEDSEDADDHGGDHVATEYVPSGFWDDMEFDPIDLCVDYGIPQSEWGAFAEVTSLDELRRLDTDPDFVQIFLETIKDLEDENKDPEDEEEIVAETTSNTRRLPNGIDDLEPLLNGTLTWEQLLLVLDERQQEFVDFAFNAGGPVMIRGGPGTGKSTVGLYRVKKYVNQIRDEAQLFDDQPRKVLYTTFTNALISESKQTLERLLGEDISIVEVATCDSVIGKVGSRINSRIQRHNSNKTKTYIEQCIEQSGPGSFERRILDSVGMEYLEEEIDHVIYGLGIPSFANYNALERTGRRQGLTRGDSGQRAAIWRIKEYLDNCDSASWSGARFKVLTDLKEAIESGAERGVDFPIYDAIVVDEAQDLDPVCLGILLMLLPSSNRLFVTEDPNQATIRQSATNRYSNIHPGLTFAPGRMGVLRKNYRTTRNLFLAAESYLSKNPDIEVSTSEQEFATEGMKPHLFKVEQASAETQSLKIASFIDDAASSLMLPVGHAAVFAYSHAECSELADRLSELGLPAQFQSSRDFEPSRNKVKVMPLHAAKGLEFPIVAVAVGTGSYPQTPEEAPDDVLRDFYEIQRKLLFVAMTRSMRALLVSIPESSDDPLFYGFDHDYWETVGLD